MVRLHNSAPTVSTFLLLSRMQGTKKCLKLNGFSKKKKTKKTNKKKLNGVNGSFWTHNYSASSGLWIHSKDFLRFFTLKVERSQDAHEIMC